MAFIIFESMTAYKKQFISFFNKILKDIFYHHET